MNSSFASKLGRFAYSKCKVASMVWIVILWPERFWRCSIIELFSSSESHERSAPFLGEFDGSKVVLGNMNMALF